LQNCKPWNQTLSCVLPVVAFGESLLLPFDHPRRRTFVVFIVDSFGKLDRSNMASKVDRHSLVMSEIDGLGHSEEVTASAKIVAPSPSAKSTPVKSPHGRGGGATGVFSSMRAGEDGTLQQEWNTFLPRPPSMRKLVSEIDPNTEQVAVFNANTQEGSTMVRVLSEKGLKVMAAVRVFTSKNTKHLIKLKGVTVKVADWSDEKSLLKVAEGCSRAFLVTKYWERFDSKLEEQMATNILKACATQKISHLVLATFEDTAELKLRSNVSQLMPTRDGRIFPHFEGMASIDKFSKEMGVQITHMMTSYLDDAEKKRSLILIRGENGRIIVQPFMQDVEKTLM
jgi:hypothetical protein